MWKKWKAKQESQGGLKVRRGGKDTPWGERESKIELVLKVITQLNAHTQTWNTYWSSVWPALPENNIIFELHLELTPINPHSNHTRRKKMIQNLRENHHIFQVSSVDPWVRCEQELLKKWGLKGEYQYLPSPFSELSLGLTLLIALFFLPSSWFPNKPCYYYCGESGKHK